MKSIKVAEATNIPAVQAGGRFQGALQVNHKALIQHESERPYTQRTFQCWKLDKRHFDALNPGGTVLDLNGYCLDAIDEIPAGCMRPIARSPAQHYVTRGVSHAEQQELEALAERLVAAILAEELA